MTRPGQKVVDQNKQHKHAMGESPNRVANTFLAGLRGQTVEVGLPSCSFTGTLLEFDLYCFTIKTSAGDMLVFKGPGVWIRKG